eukprot:ANDGO_00399.mRNA.1 Glutathione S-transferase class-mu 26 kDa isozyme 1
MTITLGYWAIRGLANPIRALLFYADADYDEQFYVTGDGPAYDRSEWLDAKDKLGLEFPNLPYLIDGDRKITQSLAILRYVARKFGYMPTNEDDLVDAEMLEGTVMDLKNGFTQMCYSPGFERSKPAFLASLPNQLVRFENKLANKEFLVGNGSRIYYIDFLFYETLSILDKFAPEVMDTFPNLKAFMKRYDELPQIKKFRASPKYFDGPINNKMAFFK